MNSNIANKFVLKQDVLNKINNSIVLAKISADTGVNFNTLKRQVSKNHEYLTLYAVLYSISKHIGTPITKLMQSNNA